MKDFKNSDGTYSKTIVLQKRINGHYYIAEAAFENGYNKLWVQSTYLSNKNEAERKSVERAKDAGNAEDGEGKNGLPHADGVRNDKGDGLPHRKGDGKKGTVSFDGISEKQLNARQKLTVNVMRELFGNYGLNIVFFRSAVNESGVHVGENGSYDPKTNTIRLDVNAGVQGNDTILFTAAHELTHFIKEWSPEKYRVFSEFLLDCYAKNLNGATDGNALDVLVKAQQEKAKRKGRTLSYEEAYEEVVADSCETFLRDSKLFDRLLMLAEKDMRLFDRAKLYISELYDRVSSLRTKYKSFEPDSLEGRMVAQMTDDIERLHKLWSEAALDALENSRAASGKRTADGGKNGLPRSTTARNDKAQKNTADSGEVKQSQRLGGYFPEINVSVKDISVFGIKDITNIKEVKYRVYNYLLGKYVSNDKISKPIKNIDTGMDIYIYKGGIDETFGNTNAYKKLYTKNKKVKLATMTSLAKLIKYGEVRSADAANLHNPNSKNIFAYLTAPIVVDGVTYTVDMDIKKTQQGNRFYVHTIKIASGSPKSDNNLTKYSSHLLSSKVTQNSENVKMKNSLRDREYIEAVRSGDTEKAQRMVLQAAKAAGYTATDEWRINHRAPNSQDESSCSADRLDGVYGNDIYSSRAVYYYGEGREYDQKAITVIQKARNNPNAKIKIYRAVPTNVKDTRVRNGDWVAVTREYADEHGYRWLDGEYRVIENTVPAKYLFNNGDSIQEFGYDNGNTAEVYQNIENNVKLAAVTYDDNGNVIPLSERFNKTEKDIRYSLREYSQQQKENWQNSKKIVLYNDEVSLLEFVEKSINNKNYKAKMYFGTVDEELAEVIKAKTSLDLLGRNVTLRSDNIRKILKPESHGDMLREKKKKQVAVQKDDFAKIIDVISVPDDIALSYKQYEGKPAVVFTKHIDERKITVIAVDSGGSLDLFVQTMYIRKNKESITDTLNGKTSEQTSKTSVGTAPANNIQDVTYKSQEKNSLRDPAFVSDRELLADVLMSAVQNDGEYQILDKYKKDVGKMYVEQQKLDRINREIAELKQTEPHWYTDALRKLYDEAAKTSNRISNYDKKLLRLEAAAPIKALIKRERGAVRRSQKKKDREKLQEVKFKI